MDMKQVHFLRNMLLHETEPITSRSRPVITAPLVTHTQPFSSSTIRTTDKRAPSGGRGRVIVANVG
jgi:hypothetical protein